MCDLNQLGLAIQEMGQNEEALQFVNQVFDEDNYQFLKYVTQILLTPDLPDRVMSNSVTLISVVLNPSIVRPINDITQNYFSFSDEEREQIKQAIVLGLTHEDNATREKYAYCLSFIVKIESNYNRIMKINIRGKPTIFDTYLTELIQNQLTPYAPIGAIMAITNILRNEAINLKIRQNQNIPDIILNVSYTVFEKLNDDLEPFDIEFKNECAKCIDQAFKSHILDDSLARAEKKENFLLLVLPNTQIPDPDLHKNLMSVLAQFSIFLYHRYYRELIADEIIPYLEQIYKDTIQPVSSIKDEDFDITEIESYARDVIKMWKKFAKYELKYSLKIDQEYQLNAVTTIASTMDEYLFSFISTLPVEDLLANNPMNTLSFFAYQCILQFSKVAPAVVFDHANKVYESFIGAENNQSIFVSFVAAQIIFSIEETDDEVIFKYLTDIIKFTESTEISIVSSAYAAITTACEKHPSICEDSNFFNFLLQAISNTIQSESIFLLKRSLKTFEALIAPFRQSDNDSNLSEHYAFIIQMLMDQTLRPILNEDSHIEYLVYLSIFRFLSKLPCSVPNEEILRFGSQICDQMQALINENPDRSLQQRALLSIIVNGIAEKLHEDIEPLAPSFLDILVPTCEEIDSTNTNINSHEEVISAISTIVYETGVLSEPLIQRILGICMNCLETQNSSLVSSAAILLSHAFRNFRLSLIDYAQDFLNILIDCLVLQNIDEWTMFFLLHAISIILNIGFNTDDHYDYTNFQGIAQILYPRREDLMNISVNLIQFLESYDKNSTDNAKSIFQELLTIFSTIMKIYFYERSPNPNDTSKFLPSEFVALYETQFIDIIEVGYELRLYNTQIGFAFLDFVDMIIRHFGTADRMNVKIHKPGFRNYFNWTIDDDEDLSLKKTAIIIKKFYEKA